MSRQTDAVAEWSTLEPALYTSDTVFEQERRRLFHAGWVNAAHVSQLPAPGSYRCVEIAGEPIVVTRDRHGELHALSRICRHRWMEVCAGAGNASRLQCPYHLWTYSLSGELRAAPAMRETPGFDASHYPLTRFRHEVWEGFVYVNLDGHAPSTRELWAPLAQHLARYGLAEWTVVSTIDWGECPWDWKVFMDNGECYHHLGAHQRTLEPLFPARAVNDLPDNGEFTSLLAARRPTAEPAAWATVANTSARAALAVAPDVSSTVAANLFAHLPNRWQRRIAIWGGQTPSPRHGQQAADEPFASALLLVYPFPNYALAVLPDVAYWYEVQPIAAGRITLRTHQLLPPDLVHSATVRGRIAANDATFRVVHREDIAVCTSVQRGVASSAARPGRFSSLERHNRTFAAWYRRRIESEPDGRDLPVEVFDDHVREPAQESVSTCSVRLQPDTSTPGAAHDRLRPHHEP